MTTPHQVKQALELALSLSEGLNSLSQAESQKVFELLGEINKNISKTVIPTPDQKVVSNSQTKESKHPIDALLKKGKVELSEGRYKQLIQIYDELMIGLGSVAMPPKGLTFLSAKQNQHCTWFPLDLNGDKSAALYLGSEWEIAPIDLKAEGVLSGEWEGFDLDQAMEDSEFDQDDY